MTFFDTGKPDEKLRDALDKNQEALAFIHALTVQATPGTDYYCPRCDHHDPELDGRLILDKQDSQEAHTYTSPPRAENAERNAEREG